MNNILIYKDEIPDFNLFVRADIVIKIQDNEFKFVKNRIGPNDLIGKFGKILSLKDYQHHQEFEIGE